MGRTARQSSQPHLPPVEKIELSSRHSGARLAAAVLLLAIGVVAIVYGIKSMVSAASGWQEVSVATDQLSCGDDFVLLYELGASGVSANAEKKDLVEVYTDACVSAYRLFNNDVSFSDVHNVIYLNQHPNEPVEVDPALYDAFALAEQTGGRWLYLAPVYDYYDNIFTCQDDVQAAEFDPYVNDETREFFARCAAFARDESAVQLRLLDGGKVELFVSEEYLAWAEQENVIDFIDFYWLKNAFIADYLAQTLADAGFTNGALSSSDGYVRALDARGGSFRLNIYDRVGSEVFPAAVMEYARPMSIVTLRDYPANSRDELRFYQRSDGAFRTAYLDMDGGFCKNAVGELTAYSDSVGCAQIALRLAPVYIADALEEPALSALAQDGIFSIWCQDRTVRYTEPALSLQDIYDSDGITYQTAYAP